MFENQFSALDFQAPVEWDAMIKIHILFPCFFPLFSLHQGIQKLTLQGLNREVGFVKKL